MAGKREKLSRHSVSVLRTVAILAACCAATLLIFHKSVTGGSSALIYALLILLYTAASAAILLYQTMREKTVRDRLDMEVSRRNFLMNAALPGSDTQLFEVLPDGLLRLLTPRQGKGEVLDAMLVTPGGLLGELNCSGQWEPALTSAIEQAAAGQGYEVEIQTLDKQETWVQIRLEPLPAGRDSAAIGTIREVTQQVKERHRQEDLAKLLDRMMGDTVAAVEIGLEETDWRMLWGEETFAHLLGPDESDGGERLSFPEMVKERVLPTLHPRDRESFARTVEPAALLAAFRAGNTRLSQNYRVKTDRAPGYDWHTSELYLFRDPVTRRAKCDLFIRLATREKIEELEEKLRLEERERQLFLRAKKLVESEEELDFVQVIADYYQGIYVVDLNLDDTRSIKVPPYFQDLLDREGHKLSATLFRYGMELMDPAYVPAFRELTDYGNLKTLLAGQGKAEYLFRKQDRTWIQMRILPMPGYSAETPVTLWVFEDETDTANLRQEEEKARVNAEAAEAANQAKSQFLANMSHEIRTPLNAILGLSEMALREEDPQGKDACLKDIRSSGRNLLENINSILDLSKIEEGKMEVDPEAYHILSVLHDTITVLRLRAMDKKLAFRAEIARDIPTALWGDDVHLSHIIMNLGSNAVKYTQQGTITLKVDWEPSGEDRGTLVLHMEDTGVGIRQEDMPYLFRSYGRLDRRANRHIEGTGLGLSIVQNLTELMGGQVGVESVYGQGSDFWVRLPQTVVDPTPCGPYRGAGQRDADSHAASFSAPDAVVLLVDDQPINLRVCQGLLEPYGMQVFTAASGPEALERMTQIWPDLVLMDHMMPGMDGVEAAGRIRTMGKKDPYFAVVPILALTANAMKGAREYFLDHGFNDFISKPMDLDRLDRALAAWVPEDKQQPPLRQQPQKAEPVPPDLADLPGLNAARGMAFCGTAAVFRQTLTMFAGQLGDRMGRIQSALDEGRREDYIIEVHSLKSAARWVGAEELGDRAESLELAGRAGSWAVVGDGTPDLLAQCQSLRETLDRATGEAASPAAPPS